MSVDADLERGDVLMPRGGERFRIFAIEPMMDAEAPVPRDVALEPALG